MQDWTKYDKHEIYSDKKNGGLLVSFLTEFKKEFNMKVINVNCGSCFNSYWETYINSLPMAKTNTPQVECDYKLKQKFNGIQLGTNGRPIRNGEMTNEIAKQLLEEHPHGANLFDVIPSEKISKKEEEKEVKDKIEKTLKDKADAQKKSENEVKKTTSKATKTKADAQKKSEKVAKKRKPSELEVAKKQYKEKFNKTVPNKFSKDLEWIKNRIGQE